MRLNINHTGISFPKFSPAVCASFRRASLSTVVSRLSPSGERYIYTPTLSDLSLICSLKGQLKGQRSAGIHIVLRPCVHMSNNSTGGDP